MLRGPLHDRGPDGNCTACGEPFPCPTGMAIYTAVRREVEHPTPRPRVEHCPWCSLEPNGSETVGSDGRRRCRRCAGCIAANPYPSSTAAHEAWAVDHRNV